MAVKHRNPKEFDIPRLNSQWNLAKLAKWPINCTKSTRLAPATVVLGELGDPCIRLLWVR